VTQTQVAAPSLAYFWGEDAYGMEHAARQLASEHAARAGEKLDTWRVSGDDDEPAAGSDGPTDAPAKRRSRLLAELELRLSTAPMFGAGTFVVVRQPGSLLRETAARERLLSLLTAVAPGNALSFVDLVAAGSRAPTTGAATLRDAIAAAGGRVTEFPALSRDRMESWLAARARDLDVQLGPGAARALAERVGAYVREGDVDRRRQSELANAELEKLALYRPGGTVTREDVAELVGEAVPGSAWAMLDAAGERRTADAVALLDRLLGAATPLPVLISQLHRRLRELIVVREHLDAGTRPPELVRALKVQPFRAQKLAEQARAWPIGELESALAALLDVDLLSKGITPDGSPRSLSDDRSRLALLAWAVERTARRPST
jgi:DNA polymerase III delta subunit